MRGGTRSPPATRSPNAWRYGSRINSIPNGDLSTADTWRRRPTRELSPSRVSARSRSFFRATARSTGSRSNGRTGTRESDSTRPHGPSWSGERACTCRGCRKARSGCCAPRTVGTGRSGRTSAPEVSACFESSRSEASGGSARVRAALSACVVVRTSGCRRPTDAWGVGRVALRPHPSIPIISKYCTRLFFSVISSLLIARCSGPS